MRHGTALLSLSGLVALLAGAARPAPNRDMVPARLTAEDVLRRTKALYPALRSYSDSGTVKTESSGSITTHSYFRTYFVNTPRNFLFDHSNTHIQYPTIRVPTPDRLVIWMRHGHLTSWHSATGVPEEYPDGTSNQLAPFVGSVAGTNGASVLIPSLIYVQAGLVNTIQELGDVTSAGTEMLRGRRCHKLMGIARSVYPSGQVTNVRPVTVWIDAETYLIRQVFTDTPKGYPAGQIARLTITYEPHLNPPLPDSLFSFTVPSAQQ
jgi:hypothetical protein